MIGSRARVLLTTLAVVGGGLVTATTSSAAVGPECFGDNNELVCATVNPGALPGVDPTGGSGFHDCVTVGSPPCIPVDAPTPSVAPGDGSSPVVVQCTGVEPCGDPTQLVASTVGTAEQVATSTVGTAEQVATSTVGTVNQIVDSTQAPGALVLAGQGTVSPGLVQAGYPGQTFTFGGSGALVASTGSGVVTCTLNGNDTIGSWMQGAGGFSGSCSTPGCSSSFAGSYTRTTTVVTMTATLIGCSAVSRFAGVCTWNLTNVDPTRAAITSFAMLCHLGPALP